MRPIIVTTSCGRKEDAESIASSVLEKRLTACAQLLGPVISSYWWDQKISIDTEYLVTMKSEYSLFEKLAEAIRAVHPYEVPEIIAVDIVAIDDAYCRWLSAELENGKI